jgi:hypothetical protein
VKLLIAAATLLLAACAIVVPDVTPTPTPTSTSAAVATSPPARATIRPTATPAPPPTAPPSPRSTPTAPPTTAPSPTLQVTPAPKGKPQGRECEDDAYNLLGYRWAGPLEWKFNFESVPERYDAEQTLEVIKQAFANVTDARNLCGRPDNIHATAIYIGPTSEVPCDGDSLERDFSVVGFRQPSSDVSVDTIAYTCHWVNSADHIVVADIAVSTEVRWALSARECRRRQHILEAVMTHEVGHAFGLDHVGRRHDDLTMRSRSGPCEYGDATLGLGDMLGLEELYGSD